jgi:hypothetical protein
MNKILKIFLIVLAIAIAAIAIMLFVASTTMICDPVHTPGGGPLVCDPVHTPS